MRDLPEHSVRINVAGLVGHAFSLIQQAQMGPDLEEELRITIRRIAAAPVEPIRALSGWTPQGLEEVCNGLERLAKTQTGANHSCLMLAAKVLANVGEQHFEDFSFEVAKGGSDEAA